MKWLKRDINRAIGQLLSLDKWMCHKEHQVPEIERFCEDIDHIFNVNQNQK